MSNDSKQRGIGIGGALLAGLVAIAVTHGCVSSCNAAKEREAEDLRNQEERRLQERLFQEERQRQERLIQEERQRQDDKDAAAALIGIGGAIIGAMLGD